MSASKSSKSKINSPKTEDLIKTDPEGSPHSIAEDKTVLIP
jgi:hypothetical protein